MAPVPALSAALSPTDIQVSTSSLIGVAISCGGNVLISLALTLQKLAHKRRDGQASSSSSPQSSHTSNPDLPTCPTNSSSPTVITTSDSSINHTLVPVTLSPDPAHSTQSHVLGHHEESSPENGFLNGPANGKDTLSPTKVFPEYTIDTNRDPSPHTIPQVQTRGVVPIIIVPQPPATDRVKQSVVAGGVGDDGAIQWREAFETDRVGQSSRNDRIGTNGHVNSLQSHEKKFNAPGENSHVRLQSPNMDQEDSGRSQSIQNQEENEDDEHPNNDDDDEDDPDEDNDDKDNGGEMNKNGEGAYLKSKLWWLGLIMMACGEGGNFLSYGFAPASVVAPLGTVALIANCAFAPLILKEKFTLRNLVGMGLSIIGAVTVVWSSNESNPRLSPEQLFEAITQLPFLVYTGLITLLLIPLILLSSKPNFGPRYIGIDIGICALFGGFTVMATKALSNLLSTMFLSSLEYPITWLAIGVLVVTSVLQIQYLNRALMRFDGKEVIPTQFVFFSMSAIIGSAVLYQEFRGVPISHFVNFAFGIATTFTGVYFLTAPSFSARDFNSTSNSQEQEQEQQEQQEQQRQKQQRRQRSHQSISPTCQPTHSTPTVDESTPLLLPTHKPLALNRKNQNSLSVSPVSNALVHSIGYGADDNATTMLVPTRAARFMTRSSSGNVALASTRLGSQGGLLLLATTPPMAGLMLANAVGGAGSGIAVGGGRGGGSTGGAGGTGGIGGIGGVGGAVTGVGGAEFSNVGMRIGRGRSESRGSKSVKSLRSMNIDDVSDVGRRSRTSSHAISQR